MKEQNNKDRQVKQVIVMRKDLNVRKGKLISQGCHSSIGALLTMFNKQKYPDERTKYSVEFEEGSVLDKWLNGIFTKICLYVESEEELVSLYERIKEEAPYIPIVMIEDCGLTEFHGVKTKTCIGIGPYWNDEIDKFTKDLKLL